MQCLLLALAGLWVAGCGDGPPAAGPSTGAGAESSGAKPQSAAGIPVPSPELAVGAPVSSLELTADTLAPSPEYVGSAACAGCHQAQYEAWRGSHHQRAMQAPTSAAVAGDFQGTAFRHGDDLTEFSSQDGRFFIHTDGPDGKRSAFEVHYTFGVKPLQQYLLALPGQRLQASRVAWDTVNGRWFDLRPGERIGHQDVMHWTTPSHNWNFMCADCHSTGIVKGYDAEVRAYQTTFAEISVGCEACHGPGAAHVAAAGGQGAVSGLACTEGGGPARRPQAASGCGVASGLAPLADQQGQINACAPCHSRRSQLQDGFKPDRSYFDYYKPALLEPGLYYADGQILDEVYVYGSFLQSRMHEAGVACGHCHEPHSAELRVQGDALCTGCHNEAGRPDFPSLPLGRYDSPEHHLHENDGAGARCVNCHMPARTYMQVDSRRDHSFRVPRPDLNGATNAPDPCTGCHAQQSPEWAADQLKAVFGAASDGHFGPVFAAARVGLAAAEASLAAIAEDPGQPAMVRATALGLMAAYDGGVSSQALERGLDNVDPLVRIGALKGAARWPPMRRWRAAAGLLQDDHLAVRSEAAALLAPVLNGVAGRQRAQLEAGIAEYLDVQAFNADRWEAHTNIGNLHVATGAAELAEAAFMTALELNPSWVPALVNLADLYRMTDRDDRGGALLRQAALLVPDAPEVMLAQAFWLVRQQRGDEALPLFAKAVQLAPEQPRYVYARALALHSAGQSEQALALLDRALAQRPGDAQLLRVAFGIAKALNLDDRMQAYQRALQSPRSVRRGP